MAEAIRVIRREGWKAAIIATAVDAVAVFLATNLLLSVFQPSWLPSRVPLPATASDPIAAVLGHGGTVGIPGTVPIAAAIGTLGFVMGMWLRVRRPLVERFEAVNPAVSEALRTARDAVENGAESRMAARLYADVLDRLHETSSFGLLDLRRVGVTLLFIVAMSAATPIAVVQDLTLGGGPAASGAQTANRTITFTGLRDGAAVLGNPEGVSAGDENLTAQLESTAGDQPAPRPDTFPDTGGAVGGGSGTGVASQQAGFARPAEIEEAELVRKYNVQIRRQTEG